MSNTNRIAQHFELQEICPECGAEGPKMSLRIGYHSPLHKHGCSRHYPCGPTCPPKKNPS